MTYEGVLTYLYNSVAFFSRKNNNYIFHLKTIEQLLAHLDNPHTLYTSIHIGGTNGKGSSSHMLASVFHEAGYRVGLYTSPHIYDLRERIWANGKPITKTFIRDFINHHKALFDTYQPSFFEIMTLTAFSYFATQKIEIAIIEVGLGGKLDSTNIIRPALSLITNISPEHTQWLGNTLDKIAAEKAGIIKKNTPVIIGQYHPETFPVFQKTAEEKNAPLYLNTNLFTITKTEKHNKSNAFYIRNKSDNTETGYAIPLLGDYQKENILNVRCAIHLLKNTFPISLDTIRKGLLNTKKNTGIKGRFEIVANEPKIILDVAHNAAGISKVLTQIKNESHRKLHIIYGTMQDKNLQEIIPLFPPNAYYYCTEIPSERSLRNAILYEKMKSHNLNTHAFNNVNEALNAALKNAHTNDIILILGSFFLIGAIDRKKYNL